MWKDSIRQNKSKKDFKEWNKGPFMPFSSFFFLFLSFSLFFSLLSKVPQRSPFPFLFLSLEPSKGRKRKKKWMTIFLMLCLHKFISILIPTLACMSLMTSESQVTHGYIRSTRTCTQYPLSRVRDYLGTGMGTVTSRHIATSSPTTNLPSVTLNKVVQKTMGALGTQGNTGGVAMTGLPP